MEQLWAHVTANMTLNNTVVKAPDATQAIAFVRNGKLSLKRCTVTGGRFFNRLQKESAGRVEIADSLLGGFTESALVVLPGRFELRNNIYFNIPGIHFGNRFFRIADFADYLAESGVDAGSAVRNDVVADSGNGVPAAIDGHGAQLPDSVWKMYHRYKKARATVSGVVFE